MNASQKTKISKLRSQGKSYNDISIMLDIPVSTVKSFCRRNQTVKTNDSVCELCGRSIVQSTGRKHKRFCSDICRYKWWNKHREDINKKTVRTIVCPNCNATFSVYGNAKRKYCCHACYISHRFGGADNVSK